MENVSKRFGATIALDGVGLVVQAGEVHALVGENGAGKSTLMKILSGAYQADSGDLWLDGQPFLPRHPLDGRKAGVAMIYQELSLAPHLSIEENILLGIEPSKGPFLQWDEIHKRAGAAMRQLGLNHLAPSTRVATLSIAEQQLVELARAVAVGCRVLVLDEPTSSLSRTDIERLFSLIGELRDRGYAVVYISHFLEEVKEVSDRFTVLRDGRVAASGDTSEVSTNDLAALMVGRDVKEMYTRSERPDGSVILEISDLAGIADPKSASFELATGEVLGIAGLVGAGRTALLRVIFGLAKAQKGHLRVGAFIGPSSPNARWAQSVGMVSEDRKQEGLALNLTVADNLTLTRLEGLGPFGLVLPSDQVEKSRSWIEQLGIKCEGPDQQVAGLSGGNQQKLALARLLYHDVDLLLLDEPTRGIDVGSKAEIYRLIDALAVGDAEGGRVPKAVLMVSSYLPELLGVCDRIAVMCRGILQPARPVEELSEHEIMIAATGAGKVQ
jgi:ribose transport system ATP-binding protein